MNLKLITSYSAVLLASVLQGAVITPDTATASSEFSGSYRAIYTIDGSGIAGPVTPASLHQNYAADNHWTTDGTLPLNEFIDWGFTAPQTLGTIYIWNHQSTTPHAANAGYDITRFDLILFDSANNVLLFLNDVALLPDSDAAQTISFAQTNDVSRVRLNVEQTQSSRSYTGLAEVRFDTTSVGAVPEPSTFILLTGGVGLGLLRRKRS